MMYLKSFNEKSSYYHDVNSHELTAAVINTKNNNFTEKEIESITKGLEYVLLKSKIKYKLSWDISVLRVSPVLPSQKEKYAIIHKADDEWFIGRFVDFRFGKIVDRDFYDPDWKSWRSIKADQVDGLIKLISDFILLGKDLYS